MAELPLLVARALWLMLPAYIANMGATIVGGGPPIDGGREWSDGRRILGDGKTWRGLLLAPAVAVVFTWILRALGTVDPLSGWGLSGFGPGPWWVVLSYSLGFGALAGDATVSFVKRRRGFERGEKWLGPDQLDFVLGAWTVALLVSLVLHVGGLTASNWFLGAFTGPILLTLLVLTPGLHLVVNYIGWRIGVKEVPW